MGVSLSWSLRALSFCNLLSCIGWIYRSSLARLIIPTLCKIKHNRTMLQREMMERITRESTTGQATIRKRIETPRWAFRDFANEWNEADTNWATMEKIFDIISKHICSFLDKPWCETRTLPQNSRLRSVAPPVDGASHTSSRLDFSPVRLKSTPVTLKTLPERTIPQGLLFALNLSELSNCNKLSIGK